MTPERWAQIEDAFHRAAESDPQHRLLVLDQVCGGDLELREQVEALLSSDQSARSRMQASVRAGFEAVAFSLAGETVSHYRILGGIGGGGMGLVYRAEDVKLGRRVAIKFLPEESAKDPAALRRFEREARSASALEDPNICPVYEFGEHEGRPFLVMQLLEGQTLRELIASSGRAKAPLELSKMINIGIQITHGLSAAHNRGIIHRDIKPANIFVTKAGEVKILDFGLAKLAHADSDPTDNSTNRTSADSCLSRTGITVGTAAYMSPEQVRGEKLDARTDLFSFGLVLYEMATGQRAIRGEPGSELLLAVLTERPAPLRQLNPTLPPKLERIIQRCIDKNPQARYQTASEIRTDLQKLKRKSEAHLVRWLVAGAGLTLLAITSFWFARTHRESTFSRSKLKLHQLTANSSENNVYGGIISPDGKYLAYSDHKGLHLKVIETGETQSISRPEELGENLEWKCAAWSPDSSKLLANSLPPAKNPGEILDENVNIWVIPMATRTALKLRSSAFAWSFSPDGSLIAFGTNNGPYGPREIWLMEANGEKARKLFESGDEDTINTVSWSADGERIIYARDHGAEVTLFSRDFQGGPPILLERPSTIKDKRIDFGLTLPDGRSIFSVTEEEGTIGTATCNFWLVRNDLRTGKIVEQPRQLTDWAGFCMDPTSVTADGRKVAFLQMAGHPTIYAAELERGGTHITNERHLTLSESIDLVAGWTPDSQSLIYWSNRNGQAGIYKQRLDDDAAERLMTTQKNLAVCCVTPDGRWFIYSLAEQSGHGAGDTEDLMRIAIEGGTSQKLFSVSNLNWWGCARSPSDLCVTAERRRDGSQAIISRFDSQRGRGEELTRIALDPRVSNWAFALSPEGKRFAVIRRSGAPLQILSVSGTLLQEIKIPEWNNSAAITWSPDGRALFVPVVTPAGSQLLHVGLRGTAQLVRNNPGGDYTYGIPSPDGHHLAVESTADNRNMWMMENF